MITLDIRHAETHNQQALAVLYAMTTGGVFGRIFDALSGLGLNGFIAGGAAVDFQLATDIDVFVSHRKLPLSRTLSKLESAFGPMSEVSWDGYYGPHRSSHGPSKAFRSTHMCHPDWSPKAIQFTLIDQHMTPEEVLGWFDLSVHAWAIDKFYNTISIPGSTKAGEPIIVLDNSRMELTHGRLDKLRARYDSR